jgi:hypothetical protein
VPKTPKKPKATAATAAVICFKCGEPGHKNWECGKGKKADKPLTNDKSGKGKGQKD